jgi:Txe/YoeB family toxin of Txe-Axe toxin-antitoxin module
LVKKKFSVKFSKTEEAVKVNIPKVLHGLYKDIPEAEQLRLRNIAKANSVPMDKVIAQFTEESETLKKQGITVNLERLAVNAVMNIYRKQKVRQMAPRKKAETSVIYGFISGDKGIWDKVETVRKQVKKFIAKNGIQAAIEAQMIDGDNNILDQRQKIYGKDNPKYLQILDPKLKVLERTLYGFFRHNGEETYRYGSIQTSDNRLARGWDKVKFFVPCQVTAIIKEEVDDDIKLASSSAEETLSIFKAVKEDVDIKKVIDDTLEGKWTGIGKVEEHHEKFKDAWDRKIFIKGIVAWIGTDRPTTYGMIKMGLMNPDNEDELVIVEIPEQIAIDFGDLSEVYVFGQTKRSKYYDDNKELVDGDVAISATGIFVVVPTPREGSSTDNYEEKVVDGWME